MCAAGRFAEDLVVFLAGLLDRAGLVDLGLGDAVIRLADLVGHRLVVALDQHLLDGDPGFELVEELLGVRRDGLRLKLAAGDDVIDCRGGDVMDHAALGRGLDHRVCFLEGANVAEVVIDTLGVDDVVDAELNVDDVGVAGDEEAVVERVERLEGEVFGLLVLGVVIPEGFIKPKRLRVCRDEDAVFDRERQTEVPTRSVGADLLAEAVADGGLAFFDDDRAGNHIETQEQDHQHLEYAEADAQRVGERLLSGVQALLASGAVLGWIVWRLAHGRASD